jgi:hypothetical protein
VRWKEAMVSDRTLRVGLIERKSETGPPLEVSLMLWKV